MTLDTTITYDCPRCQIGVCHPTQITYTRLHHGKLISVQDMTRFRCDVCGYHELDADALQDLLRLLTQQQSAQEGFSKTAHPPFNLRMRRKVVKNLTP